MDNEDKQLLLKIRKGDEQAFRKVYLKYHEELYNVALKYLRSEDLAEDAVHDIFVKLWDNRKKLDQAGSLSGFIFTSLKNHVINMVNSQKRKMKKKVKIAQQKKEEKSKHANVIHLSTFRNKCQQAIKKLPEKRRQVFKLRYEEGLTNREIADYLDLSIHTVKSQYYKAIKFIREYVNKGEQRETGT
ncbi:MAG TPA: RNA polymerase sigma-70 factor [Balneolaceae bacterium]|nr:RNA polymerase sigma-70 factor [Balneolaceae bacterium]